MAQAPTPPGSHATRSWMPSRVQVSVGRRVQTTPGQQQRRLTLALGYSFLREIMLLTRCQQNQVAAAAGDELHHLLHRAQTFLAETCEPRSGITLPQIRSYLNRWAQNRQRHTTLRLQLRKGRVYLWRVLHPTLLADTELVWQVGYTLLDRLISSLAQWEQNADGRRGWWQGRLQQAVGLAERFLDMTVELEPVYLDEQGERLSFHPCLEHKRWLVVEVLPLTLLLVAELFSRLEALRRPVYLTRGRDGLMPSDHTHRGRFVCRCYVAGLLLLKREWPNAAAMVPEHNRETDRLGYWPHTAWRVGLSEYVWARSVTWGDEAQKVRVGVGFCLRPR